MNLTGHTFGSLSVTKPATRSNRSLCLCDCGSKGLSSLTVPNTKLLRGEVTHCRALLHEKRDMAPRAKTNDKEKA